MATVFLSIPFRQIQNMYLTWARQGFDYLRENVIENLQSTYGFLNSVKMCLRVRRRGLLWVGLPCNSHTFMSSSLHKRGEERPFGDETVGFVVQGNELAYRTGLLICLALARQVLWLMQVWLSSSSGVPVVPEAPPWLIPDWMVWAIIVSKHKSKSMRNIDWCSSRNYTSLNTWGKA